MKEEGKRITAQLSRRLTGTTRILPKGGKMVATVKVQKKDDSKI